MYNDCTIYIYYNYCVQMRPQTPFYFIIVTEDLLCYHCLVFRVHVISSSFVMIFVSTLEWCTISTSNDMKFTELTVL